MWDSAYQNPLGFADTDSTIPEPQKSAFEEALRKRYEYCVALASVFTTEQGKRVLKQWRENTIEAAAWMPSLAQQHGIEAANAHAYAREGQNAFVRDIEQAIDIAQKCKTLDDFSAMINQLNSN